MYKQIGFQFDEISAHDQEGIHYYVRALVDYYSKNDMHDQYSPPGGKRSNYRAKINLGLEGELYAEIWFLYENRFRKCLIKDISETGAGVILPFEDRQDIFNKDRPFTSLIQIGIDEETSRRFFCRSTIRYCKTLTPPNNLKEVLSALNKEIHPEDKDYFPALKGGGITIDYSKLGDKDLDKEIIMDDLDEKYYEKKPKNRRK